MWVSQTSRFISFPTFAAHRPGHLSPPTYSVEDNGADVLISPKYRVSSEMTCKDSLTSFHLKFSSRGRNVQKMASIHLRPRRNFARGRSPTLKIANQMRSNTNQRTSRRSRTTRLWFVQARVPQYSRSGRWVWKWVLQKFIQIQFHFQHVNRKFEEFQQRNIVIYYRLADASLGNGVNTIPLEIPLMIASRASNRDKIVHRQIKCYTCKDDSGTEELWATVRLQQDTGKPVKETHRYGYVLTNHSSRKIIVFNISQILDRPWPAWALLLDVCRLRYHQSQLQVLMDGCARDDAIDYMCEMKKYQNSLLWFAPNANVCIPCCLHSKIYCCIVCICTLYCSLSYMRIIQSKFFTE